MLRKITALLLTLTLFLAVWPVGAATFNPEKWSPTWISPAWERPENMTVDATVSLPGDMPLAQAVDPSSCRGCHSDIYSQWDGGMHALALNDPVYQAAVKLFLSEARASGSEGQIEEVLSCVRCHTPVGHLSRTIETAEADFGGFPAGDQRDGIFCDFCHSVKACAGIGNAPFIVEPGQGTDSPGTKYGPRSDSESTFHKSSYSELHTRSEFCGMCHDVTHTMNGLPIERTYTEWRESPYNTGDPKTSVHCQDCHMRQKAGSPATGATARPDNPGKSSPIGPDRDHVYRHSIVGGNAIIPTNEDAELLVKERLQNCAEITITPLGRIRPLQAKSFQISIKNTGAGHYLPTGLSEVRQVWLHVKVTSSMGTIYESGAVDADGNIDPQARKFGITLADKDGHHTVNVALADHIESDTRIPPKGIATENFSFTAPLRSLSGVTITATLKYRSASQSLVSTLLGGAAPTLPIIDMATATQNIGK